MVHGSDTTQSCDEAVAAPPPPRVPPAAAVRPSTGPHAGWLLLAALAGLVIVGQTLTFHLRPIRSDGVGHWEYLPSLLQYHDPWLRRMHERPLPVSARPDIANARASLPAGRGILKFPLGTALLWLPFYGLACLACTLLPGCPLTSYSWPFQVAVQAAALVYLLAGLSLLDRLGDRRGLAAAPRRLVLAGLVFGTPLYHYATYDASFSHVYAFFSACLWLWAMDRFVERAAWPAPLFLGVAAGLLVLVRHTNAVLLLLLPFWLAADRGWSPRRWPWRGLLVTAVFGALTVLPQLLYIRLGTGEWLFVGYLRRGEGFTYWARPRLAYVLIGAEHGVAVFCPLLALGAAALAVPARGPRERLEILGLALVLALHAYILAAWWCPGLGGFSHRGFVDVVGLFALPLAAGVDWFQRRGFPGVAVGVVVGCGLYTSMLMARYWLT